MMQAKVTIEPDALHSLPRTQYGHFIEHLGMCIKGGIWAEGESEDMFLGGVRPKLVDAMKSISPSLIRYPGGCFADGYHWQDGIGPRSERPARKNRAWAKMGSRIGPKEDNHFGTDEFLQLCEEVGAEPQLTANVGSGTVEEAVAWVEYCNGPADYGWGKRRAKNGHPAPYNVKYWYIGNEIFGMHEIGYRKPHEYVKVFKEFARAMRKVDPGLILIASGNIFPGNLGKKINPAVLEGIGEEMDYLSIHHYVPFVLHPRSIFWYQIASRKKSKAPSVYYDVIGSYRIMEKFVERNLRDIRTYSPPNKKIPLCFDEWNLWFYFFKDIVLCNFNLRDGLWVATMLNMFHRYAPEMPLGNIAQMVNCLGVIQSTRKGTFLTPLGLVYKMYTDHIGENLMRSTVEVPPIPHKTQLPSLDISATRSEDNVAIFMVNRHYDAEIEVDCNLKGLDADPDAKRIEMNHRNPVQYNTISDPNAVKISESSERLSVGKEGTCSLIRLRLAPHSLTCIKFKVSSV